jgi:hypothetical protein
MQDRLGGSFLILSLKICLFNISKVSSVDRDALIMCHY